MVLEFSMGFFRRLAAAANYQAKVPSPEQVYGVRNLPLGNEEQLTCLVMSFIQIRTRYYHAHHP